MHDCFFFFPRVQSLPVSCMIAVKKQKISLSARCERNDFLFPIMGSGCCTNPRRNETVT